MTRTSAAICLLTACLAPSWAWAATEDPESQRKVPYVVRYLIFQHQGYWDNPLDAAGPANPDRGHTSQATNDESGKDPMDAPWRRLRDSSRYRPLIQGLAVHMAKPREAAEPIPVSDRWPASIRPPFAAMDGAAERLVRLAARSAWAPGQWRPADARDSLRGYLVFSKGRYAHLEVNLMFTEDQRWMPWGLDQRRFFLSQSRRMLPNRFYYFDHPRFGVIARIEPME